jgi:hypothetical protein
MPRPTEENHGPAKTVAAFGYVARKGAGDAGW